MKIGSPGCASLGISKSSVWFLSELDPQRTTPADSNPASFLGFMLVKTATREFCIRSSGTTCWRPLATCLISPFPISIFSHHSLSLLSCFQHSIMRPTTMFTWPISGMSFLGSSFFGCCCFYYYFYFGLASCYCCAPFSPFCSPPFYCSFYWSFYSPPVFFFSLASFAAYSLAIFLSWALDGPSWDSSGKVVKRFLSLTCSSRPGKCWIWSTHLKAWACWAFSKSYNWLKCSARAANTANSAAVKLVPTKNIRCAMCVLICSTSYYGVNLLDNSINDEI